LSSALEWGGRREDAAVVSLLDWRRREDDAAGLGHPKALLVRILLLPTTMVLVLVLTKANQELVQNRRPRYHRKARETHNLVTRSPSSLSLAFVALSVVRLAHSPAGRTTTK